MNKKALNFLKLLCLTTVLVPTISTISSNVSAIDFHDYSTYVCPDERTFFVKDSRELAICIEKAKDNDHIILQDDICLYNKLEVKSSVCIDLNGHTILVDSGDAGFVIGESKFSHTEPYTVTTPGYYTWEKKEKIINHPDKIVVNGDGTVTRIPIPSTTEETWVQVWHPEISETKYRNIYNYKDNINILLKNGMIKKQDGKKGKDGIKDSWEDYHGKDGETPSAPIHMISGTIVLSSTHVKGGNGGKGGKGGYQSLLHIVFGGGDGGNGGNGGNGGKAISCERDECKYRCDNISSVECGKGGKGGKGHKANPNWWLYPGFKGCRGKDGRDAEKNK